MSRRFVFLVALIVTVGGIIYLALSPVALAQLFLYKPTKLSRFPDLPTSVFGARGRPVSFLSSSGRLLHGYFLEKPGSKFTVLLHHGQGGNIQTHFGLAKTVVSAGCSVLIYDYEGFGLSSGRPSNQHLLDDGDAACNYLMTIEQIPPSKIIQLGVSLGTGIASNVAMNHPCATVVLISPYTSLNQVFRDKNPLSHFYPSLLFPRPDLGAESFVRFNRSIPTLVIHGESDPIIDVHHAKDLVALSPETCTLVIAPDAHHGDFSTTFLAERIELFIQESVSREN